MHFLYIYKYIYYYDNISHIFLNNTVSISPQHNNIKTKVHIKSFSQQTKLVLNVDFELGGLLVQLAPFHLRSTYTVGYCNGHTAQSKKAVSQIAMVAVPA